MEKIECKSTTKLLYIITSYASLVYLFHILSKKPLSSVELFLYAIIPFFPVMIVVSVMAVIPTHRSHNSYPSSFAGHQQLIIHFEAKENELQCKCLVHFQLNFICSSAANKFKLRQEGALITEKSSSLNGNDNLNE